MADLSITSTDVGLVEYTEMKSEVAGAAITRGQVVRYDPSTGKVVLANATSAANAGNKRGIALTDAPSNGGVTVLYNGILDIGSALSGLNYDAKVYLSDTDGTMADAAGTTTVEVGLVVPGWGELSGSKLLKVGS